MKENPGEILKKDIIKTDFMMAKINDILQSKDEDSNEIPLKLQIADKFE
jgi:hypothetical protein